MLRYDLYRVLCAKVVGTTSGEGFLVTDFTCLNGVHSALLVAKYISYELTFYAEV